MLGDKMHELIWIYLLLEHQILGNFNEVLTLVEFDLLTMTTSVACWEVDLYASKG